MLRVFVLVIERDLFEACFERFGSHCVRRQVSEASCLVGGRYVIRLVN